MKKGNGFTLVELLAVIVILAVILVIAVPKITDTITSTKQASLLSSAKMIVSSIERDFTVQQTLSAAPAAVSTATTCPASVATFSDSEYTCTYTITAEGNATVNLTGAANGKFKDLCQIGVTTDTDGSTTCS